VARNAGGTVFEQPAGSGRYFGRFTTTRQRKTLRLVACTTPEQAKERKDFIAGELQRLRDAGCEEYAHTLFKLAARADARQLARIRRGVDAIIAGDVEPVPKEPILSDSGPTFREFAEQWTSGELHRRHPDYVKRKKTADDDVYRLEAHVYPLVADVPVRAFRLEEAELVMRSLDPSLSTGSRRQIAQLLHRVLALAAYPARIIDSSPIPEGFLPKPDAGKAQAWLYPEEEARLLACAEVPLLYRMLYGFLAREGMRRDEALSLTWRDVDLERGTLTLDQNKTSDPRAWVLGEDVVRALVRWRDVQEKGSTLVFECSNQSIDAEHLAAELRRHLTKTEGIRAVLFQNTARRAPMRAHDLRATFVTLALASGETETWVCDRTGHRSSSMLNRYRRAARTAAELGLGWLKPMHEVIPELAGDGVRLREAEVESISAKAGTRSEMVRSKLIAALTESIRELVDARDMSGAQVAIEALRRLVPEGEPISKRARVRQTRSGEVST
jgi:integrase